MKWPSDLPSPALAILAACASLGAVLGVGNPQQPIGQEVRGPVAHQAVSGNTPPLVSQNSDGTLSVQREPAKEERKTAKTKPGLVIPPQVVVPIVATRK